jgi:predicted kinase
MQNPIKCFLLVGIPASGKTTYAKQLATVTGSIVLSTDEIRKKLYGSENIQGNWKEIESELHKSIKRYIALKIPVIVDATHTKPEHRKPLLKLSSHIKWSCYWLDADLNECLERNQARTRTVPTHVIKAMHKQLKLTPPSITEGFDNIIHSH